LTAKVFTQTTIATFQQKISSQLSNNNNYYYYTMAPTSPNSYISRKLNNMDQAQVMKREREDWSRLYHKILNRVEMMINMQRLVKDIKYWRTFDI